MTAAVAAAYRRLLDARAAVQQWRKLSPGIPVSPMVLEVLVDARKAYARAIRDANAAKVDADAKEKW